MKNNAANDNLRMELEKAVMTIEKLSAAGIEGANALSELKRACRERGAFLLHNGTIDCGGIYYDPDVPLVIVGNHITPECVDTLKSALRK